MIQHFTSTGAITAGSFFGETDIVAPEVTGSAFLGSSVFAESGSVEHMERVERNKSALK